MANPTPRPQDCVLLPYFGRPCPRCVRRAGWERAWKEHVAVCEELKAANEDRRALRAQKDGAYSERNKCVALLARMALALGWKAGIGRHVEAAGQAWEADWLTLLFIESPAGQLSWHFHDSEKGLLEGIPAWDGRPWDGHTTDEKYERMAGVLR